MTKIVIKKKIKTFNKIISVDSDKSLSIRSLLIGSQSYGLCKIKNLSKSGDILSTINGLRKLGVKIFFKNRICYLYGSGLSGFNYRKNILINAGNSGTFARLLLGLIIKTPNKIKLVGDNSLSKRDFKRIADPLKEFGAKFELRNKNNLPLKIIGSEYLKPINYFEKRGSAQCKSSVILAALNTPGKTTIYAKKSRNHTELLCKYLNLPIKIKSKKKVDEIRIKKIKKNIKSLNYNIPSDMSSSAFFIVLTTLIKNSVLTIKNVNINNSRIGIIHILKKMGVKIKFKNKRDYKGEKIANIIIESPNVIKAINCPIKYNSGAIDEFLVIFLVAAKAKGVSYFKGLSELNQKESPRLKWGSKILSKMGVKNIVTGDSIKIYGNPNLNLEKKIIIKNYLKDHRVFMTSVIAALSFGGIWKIEDKDSIKTSFPNFLNIIEEFKK